MRDLKGRSIYQSSHVGSCPPNLSTYRGQLESCEGFWQLLKGFCFSLAFVRHVNSQRHDHRRTGHLLYRRGTLYQNGISSFLRRGH